MSRIVKIQAGGDKQRENFECWRAIISAGVGMDSRWVWCRLGQSHSYVRLICSEEEGE